MAGKTVLLTGGTSGVGRALAGPLLQQGYEVTIVGRPGPHGEQAREALARGYPNAKLEFFPADLSLLREVERVGREFRERHTRLDILVHNAGVLMPRRVLTSEGIETTLAVNFLAPFLLTHLLEDRLRASAPARVVVTASAAHRMGRLDFDDLSMERHYRGFAMYSRTKLMDVLFTYALARRLAGSGVTANCFHPGVVRTGLYREGHLTNLFFVLGKPFMISPEKGATTALYLCTDPSVATVNGKYFVKCVPKESSPVSRDPAVAEKVWNVGEILTGLRPVA